MSTRQAHRLPSTEDVITAHRVVKRYANRTPVLSSGSVNTILNARLYLKCENFQKVGAIISGGNADLDNLPFKREPAREIV